MRASGGGGAGTGRFRTLAQPIADMLTRNRVLCALGGELFVDHEVLLDIALNAARKYVARVHVTRHSVCFVAILTS